MDKNVEAFLAVARAKTLTEAAQAVGLTQPSVTKRIANLEHSLGARLFERHRRGMTLTPSGRVFLRRAMRIELEFSQCREEVAAIGAAGLSVLRVGAGPLFHLNCVARLFSQLKCEYPQLRFELSTDVDGPKSTLLNDGHLDVYMGVIPPGDLDDSIFVKHIAEVEHGIVLRPDAPQSTASSVDPQTLQSYNWVIFAVDPETENSIREFFVPGGLDDPVIDVRTTSFSTGLQLVQEGGFVMSAPLQLASVIEAAGLAIRPVAQGMPRRQAGIHLRRSALGFGAVQSLLKFFDEFDFGVSID